MTYVHYSEGVFDIVMLEVKRKKFVQLFKSYVFVLFEQTTRGVICRVFTFVAQCLFLVTSLPQNNTDYKCDIVVFGIRLSGCGCGHDLKMFELYRVRSNSAASVMTLGW